MLPRPSGRTKPHTLFTIWQSHTSTSCSHRHKCLFRIDLQEPEQTRDNAFGSFSFPSLHNDVNFDGSVWGDHSVIYHPQWIVCVLEKKEVYSFLQPNFHFGFMRGRICRLCPFPFWSGTSVVELLHLIKSLSCLASSGKFLMWCIRSRFWSCLL